MEPGSWGKVQDTKRDGKFVARARIRDLDGIRRPVEAQGSSAEDARRNLNTKLQNRVAPKAGRGLTKLSPVSELADRWLDEHSKSVTEQTINTYRDTWNRLCKPALGELLVREVTTGTIDALLSQLADRAPSRARLARIVCAGVFSKAVRLNIMPSNPVREITLARTRKTPVRSVTLDELSEIRRRVDTYCRHETIGADGGVTRKPGPNPGQDLHDIMNLLIATAARIGEILALVDSSVHLEKLPPTVTIEATLIVPRVAGEKLWRQAHRKGGAPALTLVLPEFGVEILRRRRAAPVYNNPNSAVFVTSTGNWVSPSNVRRSWRAALGPDFAWLKPHSFRKTVATLSMASVMSPLVAR